MSQALALVGMGATTAVGFTADQTCAAIRAAVAGFSEAAFRNEVKGPKLWAEVPLRPRPMEGRPFGRLVALAATALRECATSAGVDPARCALLLGARESFRVDARRDWSYAGLLDAVQHQVGSAFHKTSQVFPDGNAAAFAALARGRELLTNGTVSACILGGVDSFLNPSDLDRFGSTFRLKSDDVSQGFIPGEAATFVAVTTPKNAGDRQVLAQIGGVGLAREAEDTIVLSDGYPNGKGLEQALRAALVDSGLPETDIAFRVSDVNGETYRGQESMLAMSRFYRTVRPRIAHTRRPSFPQFFPASCVGETGAAAGALLIMVAIAIMTKGQSPGRVAMCEASSDGGLRAGCLISVPR